MQIFAIGHKQMFELSEKSAIFMRLCRVLYEGTRGSFFHSHIASCSYLVNLSASLKQQGTDLWGAGMPTIGWLLTKEKLHLTTKDEKAKERTEASDRCLLQTVAEQTSSTQIHTYFLTFTTFVQLGLLVCVNINYSGIKLKWVKRGKTFNCLWSICTSEKIIHSVVITSLIRQLDRNENSVTISPPQPHACMTVCMQQKSDGYCSMHSHHIHGTGFICIRLKLK